MSTLLVNPYVLKSAAEIQHYLSFPGVASGVNLGSSPALDNLPSHDFSVDFWVNPSLNSQTRILSKGTGIEILCHATTIYIGIVWSGGNQVAVITNAQLNAWQHVCFSAFISGDKKARAFKNGVLGFTSGVISSYFDDSASNLYVGRTSAGGGLFSGGISWLRIRNVAVTSNFTPPPYDLPPAVDASVTEQWNFNDAAGSVASAKVDPANNGTIIGATWVPI